PGLFLVIRCWERLPLELHDIICDLLVIIADDSTSSRLSLVSKVWSRSFRPRLFSSLRLKNDEDCHTLHSILRSPLSSWLAEYIIKLEFLIDNHFHYPLCTALLRLLPACRAIWHSFNQTSGYVLRSAALKSSLRNLTSPELSNWTFPSFQTLLRVLADITYLKTIEFSLVKWSGDIPTTADAVNNLCSGSFSHVRKIQQFRCTNNAAVPAWILAATSTRHSFTRRRTPRPAVGEEMLAIIKLIQMF
ncbi:uncharacterized protein PHACADRAFT_78615, partial [Phanerochaete carnosa HHB-10118-sp]